MKRAKKAKPAWFKSGDHIVTAYAAAAAGPGWSNQPLWVIVRDANQKLREECIQPPEQGREMMALYRISEAVHYAMKAAVSTSCEK
jgi:DNA-binding transcriptional LysR family regulator